MDHIFTLTIGRASGLIALGNAVVSITTPLLIGIILVRHYNKTLSATTWTVIARQFHSSVWPTILQTDSAATKNVSWSVATMAYLGTVLAVLVSVSSIITPLGLGDEIRPTGEQNVSLQYVPDLSLYGTSTQSRPDMPLSRDCGILSASCPGAHVPGSVIDQGELNATYNPNITGTTAIPENITAMFRSATDRSTLASILDIQYRSWLPSSEKWLNNGEPYLRGNIEQMDILIPRDDIVLVEGIVADMKNGGIGFRNHTGPVEFEFGAAWTEDILWVEPDVSCSNTNLSLEFTLGDYATPHRTESLLALGVRDQGGFSGLRHGNPYSGWPDLTLSAPDVRGRADRTAWLNNFLASLVLNLTGEGGAALSPEFGINVTEGVLYSMAVEHNSLSLVPFGINSAPVLGNWLDFDFISFDRNGNLIVDDDTIAQKNASRYLLASALFSQAHGRCLGEYTDKTLRADSNVACGYMFGIPTKVSKGDRRLFDRGSEWRSSMFVCAGAVQASVKTVTFRSTNGTTSLDSVFVQSIDDKQYATPPEYPLWAMEDWRHPGSEGAENAPLWGIVDNAYEGTPGYNFTRGPSLYLPSPHPAVIWSRFEGPRDMLAGTVAPYGILEKVLNDRFQDINVRRDANYRGSDNLVLRDKWAALSSDSRGTEQIVRLVWTDMMASITVGTNLRESGGDTPTTRATIYARRITYDLRYAVPAVMVLAAWVVLLLGGLLAGIVWHRQLFTRLKEMVNDTAVGRVAAAAADPGARRLLRAPTKKWVDGAGYVRVQLGDGWEVEEEEKQQQEQKQQQQQVVPSEADTKQGTQSHVSLLAPSSGS